MYSIRRDRNNTKSKINNITQHTTYFFTLTTYSTIIKSESSQTSPCKLLPRKWSHYVSRETDWQRVQSVWLFRIHWYNLTHKWKYLVRLAKVSSYIIQEWNVVRGADTYDWLIKSSTGQAVVYTSKITQHITHIAHRMFPRTVCEFPYARRGSRCDVMAAAPQGRGMMLIAPALDSLRNARKQRTGAHNVQLQYDNDSLGDRNISCSRYYFF